MFFQKGPPSPFLRSALWAQHCYPFRRPHKVRPFRGSLRWYNQPCCGGRHHPPCHLVGWCQCARAYWDVTGTRGRICPVVRPYAWVRRHPGLTSCCCVPESLLDELGPEWLSRAEALFWDRRFLSAWQEACPHGLVSTYARTEGLADNLSEDVILAASAEDLQESRRLGKPSGRWRQPRKEFLRLSFLSETREGTW